MCIAIMVFFCSGAYTMQQEQSVAARIVKNFVRGGKVTGAATKNLVSSGVLWTWHKKNDFAVAGLTDTVTGYVLPQILYALPEVLRFNDTQDEAEIENNEDQGQFEVSKWETLAYVHTFIDGLSKHQKFKDVLAKISCDYGANVMHKASLRLLSDLHMLPHIPGPLVAQCFIAGFGNALLLEGMRDWFVQPCRQFGAQVRKLGFSGACKSLLGRQAGDAVRTNAPAQLEEVGEQSGQEPKQDSRGVDFNVAEKSEITKHLHKMDVDKHFGQVNLVFPATLNKEKFVKLWNACS